MQGRRQPAAGARHMSSKVSQGPTHLSVSRERAKEINRMAVSSFRFSNQTKRVRPALVGVQGARKGDEGKVLAGVRDLVLLQVHVAHAAKLVEVPLQHPAVPAGLQV